MAYDEINSAEIKVGDSSRKELWNKNKGNFDDHETRISAIESATSTIMIFNQIVDLTGPRVGSVEWSLLDETDMKEIHGPDMQFPNGQAVAGYDLASYYTTNANLPSTTYSGEHRFPRSGNAYSQIGNTNDPILKNHVHSIGDPTFRFKIDDGVSGVTGQIVSFISSGNVSGTYSTIANEPVRGSTPSTDSAGSGSFSKPAGYYLGMAVKMNDRPMNILLHNIMPENATISHFKIANLEAGSAGTLTVDVRKGTALNSMTTILSSPLSLSYSAGNNTESAQGAFTSTALTAGDHIALDVTSLQTGQTRFLVTCYGELT